MDFFRLENGQYFNVDEEDATHIMLKVEEYHGLCIARDIVNRRALQQLDKSVVDEHGYKLVSVEHRMVRTGNHKDSSSLRNRKYWRCQILTPHSIRINAGDAIKLIENDLSEWYGYIRGLTKETLCAIHGDLEKYDTYAEVAENGNIRIRNSAWIWDALDDNDGNIGFDIERVILNHREGLYEVVYWRTKL